MTAQLKFAFNYDACQNWSSGLTSRHLALEVVAQSPFLKSFADGALRTFDTV